jgi:hypothetical protein
MFVLSPPSILFSTICPQVFHRGSGRHPQPLHSPVDPAAPASPPRRTSYPPFIHRQNPVISMLSSDYPPFRRRLIHKSTAARKHSGAAVRCSGRRAVFRPPRDVPPCDAPAAARCSAVRCSGRRAMFRRAMLRHAMLRSPRDVPPCDAPAAARFARPRHAQRRVLQKAKRPENRVLLLMCY